MKQKCVIFYAMPYEIVDEKTGEVNEGISCTYLPSFELLPIVNDNGSLGTATVKQSLPSGWIDKLVDVPGVYDIDFKMQSVGGKPMLVPVDITFLSRVKFQEITDEEVKTEEPKKKVN